MNNPNGIPTPGELACSYDDGIGLGSTRLTGKVYGEGSEGFAGIPLEGVEVTVHRSKAGAGLGEVVGRARSDHQGHFSLGAMLPAGDYVVVARDSQGNELARAPLHTQDQGDARRKIDLLVPLDPEIRAAMRISREGAESAEASGPAGQDERVEEELVEEEPGLELAPRAVPPKVDLHKSAASQDTSPSDRAK